MISELLALPRATRPRAVLFAAVAAVVIAIPSDLIDTPIFGRPVAARWIDYVILAVTSALIGLIFAIRPERSDSAELVAATERQGTRTLWGGFVSFLAVGCPVCNQAVVALVGVSGALSWWAPVQPFVGLLAVALAASTPCANASTPTASPPARSLPDAQITGNSIAGPVFRVSGLGGLDCWQRNCRARVSCVEMQLESGDRSFQAGQQLFDLLPVLVEALHDPVAAAVKQPEARPSRSCEVVARRVGWTRSTAW